MKFVVRLTNVRGVAVSEDEIAKLHTTPPCLGENHESVCVGEPAHVCVFVCVSMCLCVCVYVCVYLPSLKGHDGAFLDRGDEPRR